MHGSVGATGALARVLMIPAEAGNTAFRSVLHETGLVEVGSAVSNLTCQTVCSRVVVSTPPRAGSSKAGATSTAVTSRSHTSRKTRPLAVIAGGGPGRKGWFR